ncbi:hypothetical protein N7520_010632 [Penicillium odoratum]|uniref:uncharacterized protein n=1 Tax=Penicillium odoratum TaxID=1167516 RepID=UPI0025470EE3|nr:uncharacterized protein N7520_010632 [Penicillium odoratum]KAJ5745450.1 hypothetical protein N7520_010632 [Penicillium odoratum]
MLYKPSWLYMIGNYVLLGDGLAQYALWQLGSPPGYSRNDLDVVEEPEYHDGKDGPHWKPTKQLTLTKINTNFLPAFSLWCGRRHTGNKVERGDIDDADYDAVDGHISLPLWSRDLQQQLA